MSDHFAYLLEEDSGDFFQKAAEDEAHQVVSAATAVAPARMEKTASAFEKFASRVDSDIEILKTAGDCGLSLGACRRTDRYMDSLLSRADLVEGFEEVWDKLAASAIEADIEAARYQLYDMVEPDWYPHVDQDLAEIGADLVKDAQMDKEALIGIVRGAKFLARTGKAAVRGVKATKGLGAATRAGQVLRAPAQAWREGRAIQKAKKTSKAWKKSQKAQAKYQGVRAAQMERVEKAKKISDPAIREKVVARTAAGGSKKVNKAADKMQRSSDKLEKRRGELAGASEKAYGSPAAAAEAKAATKVKNPADVTPPAGAAKATANVAERNERMAAAAADGKKPSYGDVFSKWRESGYKTGGMSELERQALIEGGAIAAGAAYVGKKVLLD